MLIPEDPGQIVLFFIKFDFINISNSTKILKSTTINITALLAISKRLRKVQALTGSTNTYTCTYQS
jgi:intracellular septation protein A